MTTTTANAARVMSHMEFCHQALWPELDVTYVSVTEQWAQMAVAGPKARATLQKLVDGVTLDDTTFPYLAAQRRVTVLGGIPARLFRISFSGEHAYELAVPGRLRQPRLRARLLTPARSSASRRMAPKRSSIMRIEKGSRGRRRTQRPDNCGRPRPRQDDVDQEGLYRPHDGRTGRAGQQAAGNASSASAPSTRPTVSGPARTFSNRTIRRRWPTIRAIFPRSPGRPCWTGGSGSRCS